MSRRTRSLGARLVRGAVIMIAVALVLAAVGISMALHRFVISQIDHRLDEKIMSLAATLQPASGGGLALANDAPPFDRPNPGWFWLVRGDDGAVLARSASLAGGDIDVQQPRFRWQEFWNMRPRPADGRGPNREPLHLRIGTIMVAGQSVSIVASAPIQAVIGPLWQALVPVLGALVLLGIGLIVASLWQVRHGLRPLDALRAALADIGAGRAQALPAEQPAELKPLTDELNVLLAQNVEGLERARRNVANLAHALKTPLATLAVGLERSADDRAMRDEVSRMERQIRHHLGRARAAALAGPVRLRSELAPRIADLAAMLAKVHAERQIAFFSSVPAGLAVACEAQDLDEMLGNVMDNAFKWAAGRVEASASVEGGQVVVTIRDDGPGLAEGELPQALLPGRKLDETMPGDGFGLAITRELAELYNGGIALSRSDLGGLRAAITLPLAPA